MSQAQSWGEGFMGAAGKFFNNNQFADVKIFLGDFEMSAHSFVLVCQSDYFHRALSSHFIEGQEKVFKFPNENRQAYFRVFWWMYNGWYSEVPHPKLGDPDEHILIAHIRVFCLAHYFNINGLMRFAQEKLEFALANNNDIKLYVDCVREAYDVEIRGMRTPRTLVVSFASASPQWRANPLFKELLSEGGEFVVDLMDRFRVTGLLVP